MNGALVVLNGYPGVGKTAIANELLQLFPNSRIVDVRFLDKLASGIHPVGSPENMNLRKSLRQTTLRSLIPAEDNLIRPPAATFNPNAAFYGASNTPIQSDTDHLCPPIYIFPESLYSSTHANLLDIKPKFCAANGFTLLSVILPLDTESHVMRAGKKGYKEDEIIEVRMCEEIGYFNTPRNRICREWEVVTDGLPIERAGTRVAEYILDGLRDAGWFVQLKMKKRR